MELPKHTLEAYEVCESDEMQKYLPLRIHLEEQVKAEQADFLRRKEKDENEKPVVPEEIQNERDILESQALLGRIGTV